MQGQCQGVTRVGGCPPKTNVYPLTPSPQIFWNSIFFISNSRFSNHNCNENVIYTISISVASFFLKECKREYLHWFDSLWNMEIRSFKRFNIWLLFVITSPAGMTSGVLITFFRPETVPSFGQPKIWMASVSQTMNEPPTIRKMYVRSGSTKSHSS